MRLDPTLNATGTSTAQVELEKIMGLGVVSHGMELPGGSAGLALGAIAAPIVARQFKQAGIYALTDVVLSFFGFIHRIQLGIGASPLVTFGYLFLAGICLTAMWDQWSSR